MNRRRFLAVAAAFCATPTMRLGAAEPFLHQKVADAVRGLATPDSRLRLLAPEGSGANIRPVIAAFTQATGVAVDLTKVSVDEINTQITLDALAGTGYYDLALPATFGIPDLAASGSIRPLSAYAERHEPAGFRDGILYSTGDTFDGELYGFQADGDTYVMFYHRDWMENPEEQAAYADQYGTPLAIPTTWEDLDRQMAFFHRPEQKRYGGALFRTPTYLAWEWWVRLHAKGVWPLSSDLVPQIASDEGVSALEDMIRVTEFLYPKARTAGLFDNWVHYGEGRTYCNIGWGGTQKYLNGPHSAMRGRMVYGPTPSGVFGGDTVDMPFFNWGWNYVVTTFTKQPELAYLFALFASTSEMSTIAVREQDGFFDPFRPEHYSDPVISQIYSPEFLRVHKESMRAAIPDLYLANQSEYLSVLSKWLDAAINGGMLPEKALERASTQWSVLNHKVDLDLQRDRWRKLRAKYPTEAQRVLRDLSS